MSAIPKCAFKIALTACLFGLSALSASAQNATPPCSEEIREQIAFLEGAWRVSSRKLTNFDEEEWETSNAEAFWSPLLGGCSFEERWSGVIDGKPLEWIQWIAYDPREEKWQQAMMDSAHGNIITADGQYADGVFVFHSPLMRRGRLLIDRATIEKLGPNQFRWTHETSLDGGESWVEFWSLTYTRQ